MNSIPDDAWNSIYPILREHRLPYTRSISDAESVFDQMMLTLVEQDYYNIDCGIYTPPVEFRKTPPIEFRGQHIMNFCFDVIAGFYAVDKIIARMMEEKAGQALLCAPDYIAFETTRGRSVVRFSLYRTGGCTLDFRLKEAKK